MFYAGLISLDDGQSYENVKIYEEHDHDDIPDIMEHNTFCFVKNNQHILVHLLKVCVIRIYGPNEAPNIPDSIPFHKLVISGDVIYGPGRIIRQEKYAEYGIPRVFNKSTCGIAEQLVFVTPQDGMFITTDWNIVSLFLNSRYRVEGVRHAALGPDKNQKVTAHGVIKSRESR